MQILLFITSLFSLLQTADCRQPDTFITKAQTTLLHRSFGVMSTDIVCGNGNNRKIRNWRVIECTSGVVTKIFMDAQYRHDNAFIFMEWLPPTLQFIHLKYTRLLNEPSFRFLPRDLQYLYLGFCHGIPLDIDSARLPSKMEELILLNSVISKEIRLDNMPETMRYVYIETSLAFTSFIVVNYDTLPEYMRELRVTSYYNSDGMKQKAKVIGTPGEIQLQTAYDERYPKEGSEYFWLFEKRV